MVLVVLETYELRVSQETVRRWLQKEQIVWRRPRPVVGPSDPQQEAKLQALRQLLARLPANDIAVFQDEVDVNTNPKIGAMWMRRGQQATVVTPGTNEKRYLAGSLNWRTGALILTEGLPQEGRTTALFLRHLDDLRRHLLCYRTIHVICDNARSHKESGRAKVSQAMGPSHRAPLLTDFGPRDQSHRTDLVAFARRAHSLSSLSEYGGLVGFSVCVAAKAHPLCGRT
jgi:hypothetical protein